MRCSFGRGRLALEERYRSDLARGEKIDRAELRQQLAHTYADDDDVEAIAEMIEAINN